MHRVAAALHLRRAGWILQDGAVFGVDFMLYGGVPGTVHSTWAALVVPLAGIFGKIVVTEAGTGTCPLSSPHGTAAPASGAGAEGAKLGHPASAVRQD